MEIFLESIKTTITNIIIFSLIPFIWWRRYFFKNNIRFFEWIGIYRPKLKSKWWILLVFAILYYFFYNFDFTCLIDKDILSYIENSSSVSANIFAGMGMVAILPAAIENFLANGLAEEIFYRGFLCKRLCAKFGNNTGIVLQAVLFGIMHNVIYIIAGLNVGILYHSLMFLFTGMGALLLGILNEKIFNGSIIPSILLHGFGNFIATMLIAFS